MLMDCPDARTRRRMLSAAKRVAKAQAEYTKTRRRKKAFRSYAARAGGLTISSQEIQITTELNGTI